tara:strand:- start:256 stop:480 length:225 start_codon:yes stop_codon:yes gene_type:complete
MKINLQIIKEEGGFDYSVENSIREINIRVGDLKEFKMKYDSIGFEDSLEEFISNDICSLIESELENGKFGLFNY